MKNVILKAIACVQMPGRGIGNAGEDLYDFKADKIHFGKLTKPNPVIVGRITYEDVIPDQYKPLTDRPTFIVTHQEDYEASGATICHSPKEALRKAKALSETGTVFNIGGQTLYEGLLDETDVLHLTLIEGDKPANTHFPEWEDQFTETAREHHQTDDGLEYAFVTLERA